MFGRMIEDFAYSIKYIINRMYYPFAMTLSFANPYIAGYLVYTLYLERGKFAIGGEIFIPIVIMLLSLLFKRIANGVNQGDEIPIPRKKFTTDEGDGEITINQNEISEIILYLNEVENYLEKKGRLR